MAQISSKITYLNVIMNTSFFSTNPTSKTPIFLDRLVSSLPKKIGLSIVPVLLCLFMAKSNAQTIKPAKLNSPHIAQSSEGYYYLKGRLILKTAESISSPTNGKLSNQLSRQLKQEAFVLSVDKMFPGKEAPLQQRNAAGQKLVDLSRLYTIELDPEVDVLSAAAALTGQEGIEYAEPWIIHELFYQPNDPYADTTVQDLMWYLNQIKAREAWDICKGDPNVITGIVDTGISFYHPDLQKNIYKNTKDPVDGIDNDGDGFVDNYKGWDLSGLNFFDPGDNDPSYTLSHGVAVAGTYGATPDNGIGTVGPAFNCSYMPIKASTDIVPGAITEGYQGIVYAVDQGAQIINCSWGSSGYTNFGKDVIEYATVNRGAAVVAACGNIDMDLALYPAAFDRVISVSNSSYGDVKVPNATYHYSVDLTAPGINLRVPDKHNKYHIAYGTSFSSPMACAAIALTLSKFSDMTGFQAAQRVRVTADDISSQNPNYTDKLGKGRINMLAALTDPDRPSIRVDDLYITDLDGDQVFNPGDTLLIRPNYHNYLGATQKLVVELLVDPKYTRLVNYKQEIGKIGANTADTGTTEPFMLALNHNIPESHKLDLRFGFTDKQNDYTDYQYLEVEVAPGYLDIDINDLKMSLIEKGELGKRRFPYNNGGIGIKYKDQVNIAYECGFLVGNAQNGVSDNVRKSGYKYTGSIRRF